ncbi:MAG: deoxyribonuclease V [Desulfobacterales bacterium]|nr:MAG: deoxyribonuclease V [Desulfobacterales bacterium]
MSLKSPTLSHPWSLTPQDAAALQRQLAPRVLRQSSIDVEKIKTVAGVDTHYRDGLASAAVVVVSIQNLETVDWVTSSERVNFPYVPGLLTFREGPAVVAALTKLTSQPDLLIFDGQGIAHPRRFGIASHIGLLLDRPSIGCAKSRLVGHHKEPGREKGKYTFLEDRDEAIGAVLRTRSDVKPVYVSIGHRIDLIDSIRIILKCCRRYRLPEPIRRADRLARKI